MGGKQPGFEFSQPGHENEETEKVMKERKSFIRKTPLNENRLSEEEIALHREFISEMKKNYWI